MGGCTSAELPEIFYMEKIENCKVSGTVKGYHYINKIGAYFWDDVEEF